MGLHAAVCDRSSRAEMASRLRCRIVGLGPNHEVHLLFIRRSRGHFRRPVPHSPCICVCGEWLMSPFEKLHFLRVLTDPYSHHAVQFPPNVFFSISVRWSSEHAHADLRGSCHGHRLLLGLDPDGCVQDGLVGAGDDGHNCHRVAVCRWKHFSQRGAFDWYCSSIFQRKPPINVRLEVLSKSCFVCLFKF